MPDYLRDDQLFTERLTGRMISDTGQMLMNPEISEDPGVLEWLGHGAQFLFSKLPTTWLQESGMALATHDFSDETGFWERMSEAGDVAYKVTMDNIKHGFGEASMDYGKALVDEYLPNMDPDYRDMTAMAFNILFDPANIALGGGAALKGTRYLAKHAASKALTSHRAGSKISNFASDYLERLYKTGKITDDDYFRLDKAAAAAEDAKTRPAMEAFFKENDDPRYLNGIEALEAEDAGAFFKEKRDAINGGLPSDKLVGDIDAASDLSIEAGVYGLGNDALLEVSGMNLQKMSPFDLYNALSIDKVNNSLRTSDVFKAVKNPSKFLEKVCAVKLRDVLKKDVSSLMPEEIVKLQQSLALATNYAHQVARKALKTGSQVYEEAAENAGVLVKNMEEFALAWAEGADPKIIKMLGEKVTGGRALDAIVHKNAFGAAKGGKFERNLKLQIDGMASINHTHGMTRFMQAIKSAGGLPLVTLDNMYQYMIHAMLSGPQTHLVNLTSNASYMMMQPVTHLATMVPKLLTQPHHVLDAIGDASQSMAGMVEGIGDGLKYMFRTNDVAKGRLATKHDYAARMYRGHDLTETLGQTGKGVDSRATEAMDLVSPFTPGGWLMRSDFFFKTVNYRMALRVESAKAARTAMRDGDPRSFKELFTEYMDDPQGWGGMEMAAETATINTFQKELGRFGGGMRAVLQGPGLRWYFPFFRTQANIIKVGWEHTPMGYFQTLRDLYRGNTAQAELAFTRASMGTAMMASAISLTDPEIISGTWEMGSAYDDLMRSKGMPEYHIRVGDKLVDYSKIEPLRFILGTAATYRAAINNLDLSVKENMDVFNGLMSAMIAPMAKMALDGRFISSLGQIHTLVQVIRERGTATALQSMASRLAPAFVPNAIAQFNRYQIDGEFKASDDFITRTISKIPVLSASLPPHRNLFGDPMVTPDGFGPDIISPVAVFKRQEDAIVKEINRLQVPLERPGRDIGGVQLTLEEYDRLTEIAGRGSKRYGLPPLRKTLKALLSESIYKDSTDENKRKFVRSYVTAYRKYARGIVLEESSDLQRRVVEKERISLQFNQTPQQANG